MSVDALPARFRSRWPEPTTGPELFKTAVTRPYRYAEMPVNAPQDGVFPYMGVAWAMTFSDRFPGAAQLAADLARLPSPSLATLRELRTAADAGDREAAATLAAVQATAIENPNPPAMTPEERTEAHFAARLAELERQDAQRRGGQ